MESYAEAIRRLKTQYPQYAQIPDDELAAKIVARYPQYKEVLTKPVPLTPGQQMAGKLQAGQPTGPLANIPVLGRLGTAPPLGLALPPGLGFLGRTLGQGMASAGEALLGGKTAPAELVKEGAKGALFNVGAEGLMKGLGLVGKQIAAGRAEKAYEAAKGTHTERGVIQLAEGLKKNTPALADLPSDEKGLLEMIYGKGRKLVHDAFDASFKDIAQNAKGKMVSVPTRVAERYGLEGAGGISLPPVAREALQRAGKPLPPEGMVSVDAAELAQRVVGSWKKDPGAYRAAADALDKAGIGDPAARSAYKYYSGLSQYIDKTKALKGEKFNPEAFLSGATDLKKIGELQRRGIGSATEGPLAAFRGGPAAPDVTRTGPGLTRALGAAAGSIPGYLAGGTLGHPYMGGHAGAIVGGALANKILPQGLVTGVPQALGPLGGAGSRTAQAVPQVLGPLARQFTMPIDTSAE